MVFVQALLCSVLKLEEAFRGDLLGVRAGGENAYTKLRTWFLFWGGGAKTIT